MEGACLSVRSNPPLRGGMIRDFESKNEVVHVLTMGEKLTRHSGEWFIAI
jgi:hypothetical protein